jgi:uncharacterized protein (TIGR03089 family)
MTTPTHVRALLPVLASAGGRPRVTGYATGGERVELSGAVLANWTAKTTNLLVEEFDVAPGSTVRLDLPAHWRTLVWALATWTAGGTVTLGDGGAPDVVVTDRPDHHTSSQLVAVALPALARRFEGLLPAGAVDAAAAVMTYGDVLGWVPDADPGAVAVDHATRVTHADLLTWASAGRAVRADSSDGPDGADARVLLTPGPDRSDDVVVFLRASLGVLAAGGSVVVVEHRLAAELAADPERLDRLRQTEKVTAAG